MDTTPVNNGADDETRAGRLLIRISGTVQGVGFRPFVYGLATDLGLAGFVTNTAHGVTVEVEGAGAGEFVGRLKPEAPPLAAITAVDITPLPTHGYEGFRIVSSEEGGGFTLVSPDVSVCPDCTAEMFDKKDRRYGYPFINCTNCGPRYSITRSVPYDRPNTTMAVFNMCHECRTEYDDPADRRFHAQPNACPKCGPRVSLIGQPSHPDPIGRTVELFGQGAVVAIKGLGGFHLACDATNPEAVQRLRERKRKNRKPFGLMALSIEKVKKYCKVSADEEALLLSIRRPIVLLQKSGPPLPEAVAPGNARLGFMLPYTPLHFLLLGHRGAPEVLVMTSANLSEEPIVVDGAEASKKLAHLADAFLDHDRDIFMRVDDTVMKVTRSPRFIRRARGYVPEPVAVVPDGPDVLAAGADLKNTFALMKGRHAIVSQHIGDMENYETLGFFEETLQNLKAVYRAEPVALAHDLHPGYLSTGWALQQDVPRLGVQHHHAHIASVIAEHGLGGKVIGVAFDGTGFGTDGTLWGGEFMVADAAGFKRVGHLRPVRLPGGEKSVREPWRTAVSYVLEAMGDEAPAALQSLGFFERFGQDRTMQVLKVAAMEEFSPLSSGAGRLFDAVSAMLGICDTNSFEGEAAVALEAAAGKDVFKDYPVQITHGEKLEVDFSYAVIGIINDLASGTGQGVVAAKFHNTVLTAILRVVAKVSMQTGLKDVALTGGVFQNDYLLGGLTDELRITGLNVYSNEAVPLNDGGVSLGQAHVLREHLRLGLLKPEAHKKAIDD